ncbi:hypothetical protein BDV28DRAFT_65237 [Aspergillus coremiiformis]|uniref:Tetratricopeptide repeat protein n=1 Tax=Aspergillus coremiiformis TaxID=138285 RepID=A0A5N6ZGG8_9EURO|nr:hypothetical protein BDV28DRAFT_65237 [Aspergillus coremiiformis]
MSSQSWKPVAPEGAFWESLDPSISSPVANSLSAVELNHLNAEPTLSNPAKLELLEKTLSQKLLSLENTVKPSSLHEKDYATWQSLNSALFHVHRGTGDVEKQEKILLELVNHPGPSGQDLPALQNLARLYEEKNEYAKAEKLARETLPLLQAHPVLGKDSPQSLGSLRILIKALWKQGKTGEAENLIQEANGSIEKLAGTQFSAYQQEEKEVLSKIVGELKN